jgi:predicted Fe-Mo cluster-binding NifX family protein
MQSADILTMNTMKIVVPMFKDEIAPCFEAALHFSMNEILNKEIVATEYLECREESAMARVKLMQAESAELIICNGIKKSTKAILEDYGIIVIEGILGQISEAITSFIHLNHITENFSYKPSREKPSTSLTEMKWNITEFFRKNQFEVYNGEQFAPFPVDLIAFIRCPICKQMISTAICCGAHTFLPEKEIAEFYFVAHQNFDALLYAHDSTPDVKKICSKYNIELLEPLQYLQHDDLNEPDDKYIPIIKMPVKGHEKAFR